MATHDLDAVQEVGWADRWLVMRHPLRGVAVVPMSLHQQRGKGTALW